MKPLPPATVPPMPETRYEYIWDLFPRGFPYVWEMIQPSVAWVAPLDIRSTLPDRVSFFSDGLQSGGFRPVPSQIAPGPVSPVAPPGTP